MSQRPDLKIVLIGLTLLIMGGSPSVRAEDDAREQLKALTEEMTKSRERERGLAGAARAVQGEIAALTGDIVTLTARVQDREAAALRLEANVAELEAQQREREADLTARRAELSQTLAALQRLSQRPTELALIRPDDALNVIRSARLMAGLLPGIEAQAADLRRSLQALATVRAALDDRRSRLDAEVEKLSREQQGLQDLIAARQQKRSSLLAEADAEMSHTAALARKVADVRGLLRRLDEEKNRALRQKPKMRATPGAATFVSLKGRLPLPAVGRITEQYGTRIPGGRSKGLRILTRPRAQVIAPHDGRVVFAGEFRDYGQLLIIDHGGGYHTLLAGLNRIDGIVGQWVLTGEPVGIMTDGDTGTGSSTTATTKTELYLEIRRNGQPVNPMPWLSAAARQGKIG